MTIKVATLYYNLLSKHTKDVKLLSLENKDILERGRDMKNMEREYLIPSEKFVFVMPEYNGSFPGILKLLIDNSDIKQCWWHKKVMMVGVADGRAGNLRGMDHMTGILHYMRMQVLYNKIPLSRINEEIDDNSNLLKTTTAQVIDNQIEEFLKF